MTYPTNVRVRILLVVIAIALVWRPIREFLIRNDVVNLRLGYTVELVVPSNYQGPLLIQEDTTSGIPPTWSGKRVTYVIPESGFLLTQDANPFRTWHKDLARFENGQEVPRGSAESKFNPTEVAFRESGSFASSEFSGFVSFIGTYQGFQDFLRDPRKAIDDVCARAKQLAKNEP